MELGGTTLALSKCDVFLSTLCKTTCCGGVINHRFSVALLTWHLVSLASAGDSPQTLSTGVERSQSFVSVREQDALRNEEIVMINSRQVTSYLAAESESVSELRCTFQQGQCQSHYTVHLEVTCVTGKGFSTWPGDKSQQRGMTRSAASSNSLGEIWTG